jgi:hypothetical protein
MNAPWRGGARGAAIGLVGLLAVLVGAFSATPSSLARYTDASTTDGTWATDTLSPPTGLVAVGGTGIDLTWTPTVDSYASGYEVRRGTASGGPFAFVVDVTPGSASAFADTPGGGTWYYVLRSFYQSWTSVNSNVASATVSADVTTSPAGCTTTAADTTGAGDNNGYEVTPAGACADGGTAASDVGTGTGGTQACGTGAVPATNKDRHRFWGFATGLPGSVSSILGITVRADVGMNNNGGTSNLCAQLSWDGGTSWTALKSVSLTATAETTFTLGGPADTWGRTWTRAQLQSPAFVVRLVDASSQPNKDYVLDYVAVSVTYTP